VLAGDHVVEEQRAFAQRLERGAALGQAAVTPRQQHLLPPCGPKLAEPVEAATADRGQEARVPQREQLRGLLALGLARIHRDGVDQRARHAHLRRARRAVRPWRKRVANGLERTPLLGAEVHRPILTANYFLQSGHDPRNTTSCSATVYLSRRASRSIAVSSASSSNWETLPQRSQTT
jgi:hypothetical protein